MCWTDWEGGDHNRLSNDRFLDQVHCFSLFNTELPGQLSKFEKGACMTIAKHTLDVTINTHGNKHEVECYFDKGISPHSEKTRPVTFSKNNLGGICDE